MSEADLESMDVIGYDRVVPEPSSIIPLALGLLALLRIRRRS